MIWLRRLWLRKSGPAEQVFKTLVARGDRNGVAMAVIPGNSLLDRFHALLGKNTRFFDCLVGYFFISGFHKLYPSLEHTEKARILIGLKTDSTVFESLELAKEQSRLFSKSHAQTKEELPAEMPGQHGIAVQQTAKGLCRNLDELCIG